MLPLLKPLAPLLLGNSWLSGPSSARSARFRYPEPSLVTEPYQLELIRSYASSGITAVVTINSGALIAGLSQVAHLDFVAPMAVALSLFIWALGVTAGVGAWGAAFHGVVAQAVADQESQSLWTRTAAGLFHLSLFMFLLGFLIVGLSVLL